MKDDQRLAEVSLPSEPTALWRVVGLNDFNGDQKTDIVWQHSTTGQVFVWYMNGTTQVGGDFLSAGATTWTLSATGDLNGDGKADVIWSSPAGDRRATFLNGLTVLSEGPFSTPVVPVAWRNVGLSDLTATGRKTSSGRNPTARWRSGR